MPRPKKNKQAGAAFKELLKEKGFSNSKLAKAIGMGAGHIGRIASGEIASPTPATLEKIAAVLGVELGVLTMIFAQSPVRSHSATVPQPQEQEQEETPSKNTDFVGREEAIAHLGNLVSNGTKIIGIYAKGGVGKTTLARQFFKQRGLDYWEIPIAIQPQDVTPVEERIKNWLRLTDEGKPELDFGIMLQRVKEKLQAQKIGVLIDNLEPALDDKGKFIQNHRRYVELLRLLADPDVQSVTLITSRERLNESKVTVKAYKLPGLDEAAWRDFFSSHNIDTDSTGFREMHKAYGGNAKAMQILRGAILEEDYEGDLEAYWQENKGDLLIEKELEDLVSTQFTRLKQTDPDAYKLLCRLGVYNYQDIPVVPIFAIQCLLWDVPKERHKRLVKSLQERFLLESPKRAFWTRGYWLHPMIRAEAISRLRPSGESKDDVLLSMKQEIDGLLGSNEELKMFLTEVNQKSISVSNEFDNSYKPAAIRAFYFELGFPFTYVRSNLKYRLGFVDYGIKGAFAIDSTLITLFRMGSLFCNTPNGNNFACFFQVYICENASDPRLRQLVEKMRDDLQKHITDRKSCYDWWQFKSKDWIESLFSVINYRNLGYALNYQISGDWYEERRLRKQFSEQQEELLKQYHEANRLLVDCLNNASDTVRSHIEDTLLLPIAEIEKRRLGD